MVSFFNLFRSPFLTPERLQGEGRINSAPTGDKMSNKNKSPFRINLEYYPTLLGVKIVKLIPLRLAFILAQGLFLFYFYVSRRHAKRAVAHLLHAGIVSTREEAVKLARKNFMEYGKIAVEILRIDDVINKDTIQARVKLVGDPEEKKRFLTEPGILVSAHLGNWELAGITYTLLSNIPLLSVMRPMENPKLQDFFYRRVDNHNHDSCLKQGAIKAMLKALRSNRSVAVTADQHASSSEGVESVFFGHPARTHFSPALLHLKTGRPIFCTALRRTSKYLSFEMRLYGIIEVKPTDNQEEDLKKTVQLYTDMTEGLVREAPEQWLWVHRRWLDISR